MQNVWAILILFFSSLYVLILDHISFSSRVLQKSMVLPLLILFIIFYHAYKTSWKATLKHEGKWFLLPTGSVIVQTLIVSTGGLQSPFLILIHLFMIGMSFFMGFAVALVFLLLSFVVLLADITFNQPVLNYAIANPSTVILQIVSLFSIIPIAYIISQQYHIKEVVSSILQEKIKTDEEIFRNLQELIIITDVNLTILSINDAVERTLQKPKSEILHTPLFNTLLLKDDRGQLVKKEMIVDHDHKPIQPASHFTIINASKETQKVVMQIQTIASLKNNEKQFSFIFSSPDRTSNDSTISMTIKKARAKYEALIQALKTLLSNRKYSEGYTSLLLIEKIENDLYTIQSLQTNSYQKTLTNIDIAVLCRKIVDQENIFAQSFPATILFTIDNFGQEDVTQLTGKNFHVDPEKFTGPFFTLPCDANGCEIVLTKLLDLSLFLASSSPGAQVAVILKRDEKNIIIQIKLPNPGLTKSNLDSLFAPNYINLESKSNIHAGSDLEGYIIKTLSNTMDTPVTVELSQLEDSSLIFTWVLKKRAEVMLKQER